MFDEENKREKVKYSQTTYSLQKGFMIWPLAFLVGQVFAHPFFVIAARVQYSGFEGKYYHGKMPENAFSNMFKTIANIKKFEGIRGFYKGFIPSTIFVMGMYYADLYYLWTGRELHDVRETI